jgi:hypothetical protein
MVDHLSERPLSHGRHPTTTLVWTANRDDLADHHPERKVWGLYGPWLKRDAAIVATVQAARPDAARVLDEISIV